MVEPHTWRARSRKPLNVLARVAVLATAMLAMPRAVLPPLEVGPQQVVETQHPITCTHTRLTDEVEPWKILRTLELVREMGAPTVVEYFPWAYYEPEAGIYDFAAAELRIDLAANQGVGVVARLGGIVPSWARPQNADGTPGPDTFLPEEHFPDFADFVAAFVERFDGRLAAIILWNEPNIALEWGFRRPDPEAYTRLIRLAADRAHAADPDLIVLAGALAPTLEPEGSDLALNDLVFLERMYAAGAADVLDGLAVHAYGLSFPPDDPPAPDALNFRRVELVREVMARYGEGEAPIYVTEMGWNDSPRWTRAVRPGVRIDYTIAALAYAEANWANVPAVCIWAFRYPAPQRSYGDYFTLVTPEFVRKPIYDAVRDWAVEDLWP
ncbi:MAG TPA: beta-galactosidase [Anaerolineales bacterium]|nr:beta-galactosidase [Anaerolineales bacterium]HRF50409.1 beta-galactosidase [Anaerolineales bacterium]